MRKLRPHVFSLTPDEQAAWDLYKAYGPGPSIYRFALSIGVCPNWFHLAVQKARDIEALCIDEDQRSRRAKDRTYGFSSLNAARHPHRRMEGTR